MEAAGIESKSLPVLDLLYAGLMGPNAGQDVSQPGQGQDLASGGSVELGTVAQGEPVTSRTDQEHKISIKSKDAHQDSDNADSQLEELNRAWPFLTPQLRMMVMAAIRRAR